MTRHLADRHDATSKARVKQFLRIDHSAKRAELWKVLWQRPVERAQTNRRLVEYLRIERGVQS